MDQIAFLTPAIAVAATRAKLDLGAISRRGFKSVIDSLPRTARSGGRSALASVDGLTFVHVPAAELDVFKAPVVEAMAEALASVPGPVLLHSRSALRSAMLWAAAAVRLGATVDAVLIAAGTAGYDLRGLRSEISGRRRRADIACDAGCCDCTTAG